jgi:hypothetical protein
MIKVQALSRELVDGHPAGGAHFYWEPGSRVVLVQEWEHRASGPVWDQVVSDPMAGTDLCVYIKECWDHYIIVDVEEEHC